MALVGFIAVSEARFVCHGISKTGERDTSNETRTGMKDKKVMDYTQAGIKEDRWSASKKTCVARVQGNSD